MTPSFQARLHRWVAAGLLFSYAFWMLYRYSEHATAAASVVIVAAGGVLRNWRWTRYLVYVLACVLVVQWGRFVFTQILNGSLGAYISSLPLEKVVLVFAPAGVMFLLTGYCCFVAYKYVGSPEHT